MSTQKTNSKTQATIEQLNSMKETLEKQNIKKLKSILNPSVPAVTAPESPEGTGISRIRKTREDFYKLYLLNQFLSRAVNVRADTLVIKGYNIVDGDETGREACSELVEASGGLNLFWMLSANIDISGDGFLEKVPFRDGKGIALLKQIHPLVIDFKRNQSGNVLVDSNTKKPVGYVQKYVNETGQTVTEDIKNPDIIEHLRFNTVGDEFVGVSLFQSGYDTVVRLMNMEYSAAESAVKIANPIIVAKCNTKSPQQIAKWGQILGNINGKEQLFIPEGMSIDLLSPGKQNFNEYADYFLNAAVATTGVPRAILLGESGSSNRAETLALTKHFYSMIRVNQKYIETLMNKIFKEYAEMAGFEAPKFYFENIAEDYDISAKTAIELVNAGIITPEEARLILKIDTGRIYGVGTAATEAAIKKSDMETYYPGDKGNEPGSQAGVKTEQKVSKDSDVNPFTK